MHRPTELNLIDRSQGMSLLRREFEVFFHCSRSMQVLIVSNIIYALVLPVIDIFVAAYVMRNSHAVATVVAYQLAVYVATPVAFYLNGILLGRVGVKHLYAAGMLLSGAAMMMLMRSGALTPMGIATSGLAMGLATGLFWANRGFLALATTSDDNRNYYYGVELFFATLAAIVVPALIGWLISGATLYGWLGGTANRAYRILAMAAFGLTVLSAILLERDSFRNPGRTRFVFFRFHALWRRMIGLALLKGLAQGYMLTAPAMLILLLVGKEGTLGATQAIGGVFSASLLYTVGRATAPRHRRIVFAAGLVLFLLGAVSNALLFNALGVLIFIGCLALAKPLLDLAYNPIEFQVVDVVSRLEKRNEYAYLFHHEIGLFIGRFLGCVLFLSIAHWWSGVAALKYALPVIALLQLLSIRVAGQIYRSLQAAACPPFPDSGGAGQPASNLPPAAPARNCVAATTAPSNTGAPSGGLRYKPPMSRISR
jgi:YQGE family putative transporter